jgi:CheY-like chemotaxis protein
MRIVWVEDSQAVQFLLKLYCEKHKASVEHISDIEVFCDDFVKSITNDDIILLDVLFDKSGDRDKEGRGYWALESLRRAGKSHIPVVILSVLDKAEVNPKVRQYPNVRRVVRKPVFPDELAEALDEAWAWHLRQREQA